MQPKRTPTPRSMDGQDADNLESVLKALEHTSRTDLASRWRDLLGAEPPKGISQRLMLGAVAHALQVKRHGGLSSAARRRLDTIAAMPRESVPTAAPPISKLAPGARLIREWNGTTHVVDVIDGGYLWNGVRYRSLSVIALAITGTQWSGPRFFGLRSRAKL